jgi:hypothetical protein
VDISTGVYGRQWLAIPSGEFEKMHVNEYVEKDKNVWIWI